MKHVAHQTTQMVVLISALLFLSACTGVGKTDGVVLTNEIYHEGIDALEMDFAEQVPPDTVIEGSDFEIGLNVHNKGAYFLNGIVTLSIEEDFMCIVNKDNQCVKTDLDLNSYNPDVTMMVREIDRRVTALNEEIEKLTVQKNQLQTDIERKQVTDQIDQKQGELKSYLSQRIELLSSIVADKSSPLLLEPRSIYNPNGGSDILIWNARAKSPGSMSEKHTSTIIATACYAYSATVTHDVCIDTASGELTTYTPVCKNEEILLNDQGGPLAITQIQPKMIPSQSDDGSKSLQPQFLITVRNEGEGSVINKDKVTQACSAVSLGKKDYGMVTLNKVLLSNEQIIYRFNGYNEQTYKEIAVQNDPDTITCTPNPIYLDEHGEGITRCTVNKGMITQDQSSYMTQLYIELSYGYTHSSSKEITIERSYT